MGLDHPSCMIFGIHNILSYAIHPASLRSPLSPFAAFVRSLDWSNGKGYRQEEERSAPDYIWTVCCVKCSSLAIFPVSLPASLPHCYCNVRFPWRRLPECYVFISLSIFISEWPWLGSHWTKPFWMIGSQTLSCENEMSKFIQLNFMIPQNMHFSRIPTGADIFAICCYF